MITGRSQDLVNIDHYRPPLNILDRLLKHPYREEKNYNKSQTQRSDRRDPWDALRWRVQEIPVRGNHRIQETGYTCMICHEMLMHFKNHTHTCPGARCQGVQV